MIIEQKDCHGIKRVVKLILKMETVIPFKTQMRQGLQERIKILYNLLQNTIQKYKTCKNCK